jgi:aryl-alcohol dehydrogenase-like predicted oxidoreductase
MVDHCATEGIAYVPFFPLGGAFRPMEAEVLGTVAARHEATGATGATHEATHQATPQQIALAWLLARSPSLLLIPGTSSIAHLEQNVAAASIVLTEDDLAQLDAMEN